MNFFAFRGEILGWVLQDVVTLFIMSQDAFDEQISSKEAAQEKIRAKVFKEEGKNQKELAHWQKEKAKAKHPGYLWYLMLVLALVYIVDEVATNLNSTMQPYMTGIRISIKIASK